MEFNNDDPEYLVIATALNPRYKTMRCLSAEMRNETWRIIQKLSDNDNTEKRNNKELNVINEVQIGRIMSQRNYVKTLMMM